MTVTKINIKSTLDSISELWKLKEVGRVNNHRLQMIKLKGEFEMHKHDEGDKLFYVLEGALFLEFPTKEVEEIKEGECVIVPKSMEQKPFSPDGVSLLILELA